jgi:glutathione S-transferase
LIPADPFEKAKMMSWLFWEQYSHEPYIAVRRFRKKFMNMTDDELDPQLLARGRRALGVMEMQLTFSDYFVGERHARRHRARRLHARGGRGRV